MNNSQKFGRQSLYIPHDLMQSLKDRAEANGRSFNKEVVQMIQQYLSHEQQQQTQQHTRQSA